MYVKRFTVNRYWCLLLLFIVVGLCSCGGDGGSSSDDTTTTVSGVVADGYVSNAKVYVYSDMAMTNQIGSGVTDSSGKFSIQINTSLPKVVYIKSTGGILVDTGMPAPTMSTVVPTDSVSVTNSNISPITNYIYQETISMGGNLTAALKKVKAVLNIDNENMLWQDPVNNTELSTPINQILSSGVMSSTLADGTYKVTLLWFDNNDINLTTFTTIDDIISDRKCQFTVSIVNGEITGQDDEGDNIVGKVEGSSLIMNIVGTSSLTRVCGNIGLLGSVTGTYTDYDSSSTSLAKGVFVATFIPSSGINKDNLISVINNMYSGEKNSIFRDVFGEDHDIAWGNINISIDTSSLNATADNVTIHCLGDNTTDITIDNDTLVFRSGRIITDTDGSLDNIVILKFIDSDNYTDFFIQAIGSRQGVYLSTNTTGTTATGKVLSIGESYMSPINAISNYVENSTSYNINIATIGVYTLGASRQTVLSNIMSSFAITTSANVTSSPYVQDPNTNTFFVLKGNILTIVHNPTGSFNATSDFIASAITYNSGAFDGRIILGGNNTNTLLGSSTPLYLYPAPFVGTILPTGVSAPSFTGTKHILVRVIYTTDYSEYQNAYYYGTITVNGEGSGSVKLDVKDAQGNECISTLNCENTSGILHIYGADDPNDPESYIDIYWPIGGHKAIYFHSDSNDGSGHIDEIGSAYLTD